MYKYDNLDTRDLNKRLSELIEKKGVIATAKEELEELKKELANAGDEEKEELEEKTADKESDIESLESDFDEDEQEELAELENMESEISEWRYGEVLIHEDNWVSYVKELLEDCGDLPKDLPWYIVINWKETADNLKSDYSEIEYQGNTYYYRS